MDVALGDAAASVPGAILVAPDGAALVALARGVLLVAYDDMDCVTLYAAACHAIEAGSSWLVLATFAKNVR